MVRSGLTRRRKLLQSSLIGTGLGIGSGRVQQGSTQSLTWFGLDDVRGDGLHDDTAGLQRALDNAAATTGSGLVVLPPGSYRLSEPLKIHGNLSGFTILGAGRVTLIQSADNVPVFKIVGQNSRRLRFGNLVLRYEHDQSSADREAIAICIDALSGDRDGIWNSIFHDLTFVNGFRGISGFPDDQGRYGFWGCTFERISAASTQVGATLALYSASHAGWPNNRITSFYARADSSVEPAILLRNQSNMILENIEVNKSGTSLVSAENCRFISVKALRLEGFDWRKKIYLVTLNRCLMEVTGIEIQSIAAAKAPREQQTYFPRLCNLSRGSRLDAEFVTAVDENGSMLPSVNYISDNESLLIFDRRSSPTLVREF